MLRRKERRLDGKLTLEELQTADSLLKKGETLESICVQLNMPLQTFLTRLDRSNKVICTITHRYLVDAEPGAEPAEGKERTTRNRGGRPPTPSSSLQTVAEFPA